MVKEHEDFLDIEAPEFKTPAKKSGNLAVPIIIFLVLIGLMVGGYLTVNTLMHRSVGQQQDTGPISGATAEDMTKRQLSSFVEQFLLCYYNYSYTLYDQSVQKAESMMTPSFQTAYNARAQDLDFKRKLNDLRVSTDGIRIIPGSMSFGNQGATYYVRLAGTMIFTTGVNGVSGDFPLNLLLEIQKSDTGYLVNNVERIR